MVLSLGKCVWSSNRKLSCSDTHVSPRGTANTPPPILILSSSPLTGMPADNITGMAHWRWAFQQWPTKILCQMLFLTKHCQLTQGLDQYKVYCRGRPIFGCGFGYGAKTASKMTFGPVSVSAIVVSAKFPLQP